MMTTWFVKTPSFQFEIISLHVKIKSAIFWKICNLQSLNYTFSYFSPLCLNHTKAILIYAMTKWWGTWVWIAIRFYTIIKSHKNKNTNCKYRLWFHVHTLAAVHTMTLFFSFKNDSTVFNQFLKKKIKFFIMNI